MALPGGDGLIERPAWAAGERNDAGGLACASQSSVETRRLVRGRFQESARRQSRIRLR